MKKSALALVCVMLFSFAAVAQDKAEPSQLTIHVRDYCDPASFNAALATFRPEQSISKVF